ncbi:MAG: radical SAM protein [Crenarchaeota archaeon]|nr:radical SAM protein [Thermoproteota archaeon]
MLQKDNVTEQIIRKFDPWKGRLCTCPPKYTLNPYTGCSHMCLYCYATSYIGRRRSTPKRDAVRKVLHDLKIIDRRLVINMSTSSDPYPPEESDQNLTRRILDVLVRSGCRVLITTKGSIFERDLDIMRNGNVAIMVTITTLDRDLSRRLEPGAPSPEERIRALEKASGEGIPVGVRIDPVIPYINDDPKELREIVKTVVAAGARHITTSTYKARPDNFRRIVEAFPELESKLRKLYYENSEIVGGYRYLRIELRKRVLKPIIEEARIQEVSYATCREGIHEYRRARTCDGSHLIDLRHIKDT